MTHKVRQKKLEALERRRIVAMLNTLRWAEYAMRILEQQRDLAKEGLQRTAICERLRQLREKGIYQLTKDEAEKNLLADIRSR